MMMLCNNVLLATVLLLPLLYARQLSANTNEIISPQDTNLIKFLQQRYYRQNEEPISHSPQQQTSSFWNLLNTHGIGISAHLGAGIRLASSDNHGANDPSRTPRPSTNSVWDRYLGSTLHVGLNTHLGNNKQGQEGAAQQAHSGSLPILGQAEDENKQLVNRELTSQPTTYWERLVSYLPWNRWDEQNCNSVSKEDCNNISSKILSRIFTRLFLRQRNKEESIGQIQDGLNSQNKTIDGSKEYDQSRINNETSTKPNGLLQDFQTFTNTVRQFFVDRFSSYITQGLKNEQFLQTMIRKSVINIVNETEPKFADGKTNETDPILLETLSTYYTDERVRQIFPEVELVRLNIASQNISNEDEYDTWFDNNFLGWFPFTSHRL